MIAERCPRCGQGMPGHPGALSRWDNKTMLCPDCGTQEAVLQFLAARSPHAHGDSAAAASRVIDPVEGVMPWVDVPAHHRLMEHGATNKEETDD